jgi:hypothetical protein
MGYNVVWSGKFNLTACFMLVSCLAYSWTLKMEAICSSEKWAEFHQTTLSYIPKDTTLQCHIIFRHKTGDTPFFALDATVTSSTLLQKNIAQYLDVDSGQHERNPSVSPYVARHMS